MNSGCVKLPNKANRAIANSNPFVYASVSDNINSCGYIYCEVLTLFNLISCPSFLSSQGLKVLFLSNYTNVYQVLSVCHFLK